jgi:hypothetical protein
MAESVLVRLADARVRTFEDEIAAAKRLTDQAQLDSRAAELIDAHQFGPDELERGWALLVQAAEKMSPEGRVRTGQLYYKTATLWVDLTAVLELLVVEKVHDPEVKAKGLRELPKTGARLRAICEKIWREWRWFTEEDTERARTAEARGELISGDELFAKLARVSAEGWRQRVEARKAGGVS